MEKAMENLALSRSPRSSQVHRAIALLLQWAARALHAHCLRSPISLPLRQTFLGAPTVFARG